MTFEVSYTKVYSDRQVPEKTFFKSLATAARYLERISKARISNSIVSFQSEPYHIKDAKITDIGERDDQRRTV